MDKEIRTEKSLNDFDLNSPPTQAEFRKLAHKLLRSPEFFLKSVYTRQRFRSINKNQTNQFQSIMRGSRKCLENILA